MVTYLVFGYEGTFALMNALGGMDDCRLILSYPDNRVALATWKTDVQSWLNSFVKEATTKVLLKQEEELELGDMYEAHIAEELLKEDKPKEVIEGEVPEEELPVEEVLIEEVPTTPIIPSYVHFELVRVNVTSFEEIEYWYNA